MNILLVRPKPHPKTIGLQSVMICEPLELEYLAAAVKGEHAVELVDMILEKRSLAYFVAKHRPRVVAFTAYIAHVNVVKQYARAVKQVDPAIKVVVGGVHAEVVPGDFACSEIDYIVTDNGIAAFQELLKQIETGKLNPVPGVISSSLDLGKQGEKCPFSAPEIFPDREITNRYRKSYYYVFHNPCALIKTSYGCPFSCTFCFCRQVTGGKYYERDLDSVITELKGIKEPEVYIVDDNFLVDKGRVEQFCDLLEENKISKRFLIYGRADFIAQNEAVIKRFSSLGLRAVIVGLESGNPRELDRYNKKSSVDVNERAVHVLEQNGVDCYATLILGTDWEKEDFRSLYRWLKGLNLRFINLQPFTPLPGTPLFSQFQDALIVPRESYEQWDLANLVVKPEKMSIRSFYFNMLLVYFRITLNYRSTLKHLSNGLIPSLKLSLGVARITWQYLLKILHG